MDLLTKSATDVDFFKANLGQSVQNAQRSLEKAYQRQERMRQKLSAT